MRNRHLLPELLLCCTCALFLDYFFNAAEASAKDTSAASLKNIIQSKNKEFNVDVVFDSLLRESYRVFHFLRNDIGVYRDAARFEGQQVHPASVDWNSAIADPAGGGVYLAQDFQFLSGFVFQFPYYLCHYFTADQEYVQFFRNAMDIDRLCWRDSTGEADYARGSGAGASAVASGYHTDNLLDHPGMICSPHIIAGFIPVQPLNLNDLKNLYQDVRARFMLSDEGGITLLWRFSTEIPAWHAPDVQGVDFTTMLFGLASHPDALGPDFFPAYNNFDFPDATIVDKGLPLPAQICLQQNFPNPFNPQTTITYELPASMNVRLSLYDIHSREINILLNEQKTARVRSLVWHGTEETGATVASGIYFYRLEAGKFIETRRLTLLR